MTEGYQLWGVRPAKVALVKLKGFPNLRQLKTAWRKTLEQGTARQLQARLYLTDTEYKVINDQMETVELREFNSSAQRDQRIIDGAIYFTAVCFLGTGQYDRQEKPTLGEVRELALKLAKQRKKNYIIYAVNKQGNSAYVETIRGN